MSPQGLAGSRIRQKRLDRGLRQATVAETVGISPSYLNLIEHNRRRIGGKLLAEIARVLEVDPALLTDGVDNEMLDQMRGAAALLSAEVELSRAEELAARYPGWSALIAAQSRRIEGLQNQVQSLSDRISFDPQLAQSLHEVISSVTAIRSSASILVGPEALDSDWQRRFHQNIHDDSVRLAKSSEALVAYLEAPEEPVEAEPRPLLIGSPAPPLDIGHWIQDGGGHFEAKYDLDRSDADGHTLRVAKRKCAPPDRLAPVIPRSSARAR